MSLRSSIERGAMLALFSGSLALNGCGEENSTVVTDSSPKNTITRTESSSILREYSPEVTELYPEIANIIPEGYRIDTKSGKETNIYNLADIKLNTSAVKDVYDYLEEYIGQDTSFGFTWDTQTDVFVFPHPIIQRRNTLFLPNSAPLPSWKKFPYAMTRFLPQEDFSISYLQVGDKKMISGKIFTDKEAFTMLFAVEACQQSLLAVPFDSHGDVIPSLELQNLNQELICNSVGQAIFRRLVGDTYDQYVAWIESTGEINIPGLEGSGLTIIDKERFEAIPNTPIIG